jgi:hypothetical protein
MYCVRVQRTMCELIFVKNINENSDIILVIVKVKLHSLVMSPRRSLVA